ncbi:MAG: hypothetical protein ABJA69_10240 [Acidobacteriaceae bacterium]
MIFFGGCSRIPNTFAYLVQLIDVWKRKREQATLLHEAELWYVKELEQRKQRLVEAFVYKREIDQLTYKEQLEEIE